MNVVLIGPLVLYNKCVHVGLCVQTGALIVVKCISELGLSSCEDIPAITVRAEHLEGAPPWVIPGIAASWAFVLFD